MANRKDNSSCVNNHQQVIPTQNFCRSTVVTPLQALGAPSPAVLIAAVADHLHEWLRLVEHHLSGKQHSPLVRPSLPPSDGHCP
jgi:hypothetical protein